VPTEHQFLGRLKLLEHHKTTYFPIDGPGGERIEVVQIGCRGNKSMYRSDQRTGQPDWIKVRPCSRALTTSTADTLPAVHQSREIMHDWPPD
jgi:hypothetical protein